MKSGSSTTSDGAATTEPRHGRRAIDMTGDEFRAAGHALVDQIAAFYDSLRARPVTAGDATQTVRDLIGQGPLPSRGEPAAELLGKTAPLLFDHSLHNGHPRFLGYITSSAAPLGALADLLAAAVNANVGLWDLAPVATEIEAQTIRWLAELVGFPASCGGLMVSGGNMANFLAFIAARRAKASWNVREEGVQGDPRRMMAYASRETHTWIQKAADIAGLGTSTIRWIDADDAQRIDVAALRSALAEDEAAGHLPFLVVGTAGSVSTGAVDPLGAIAEIAREHDLWFHVDGAYGAPAAALPEASPDLRALARADSVALDPHKWLFSPLEAACVLVRDRARLLDAFSYRPPYYEVSDEGEPRNDYYEHGIQNSRGFRALKVWLGLKHLGSDGCRELIRDTIARAHDLFRAAAAHAELEAQTLSLSIATFRFVPRGLKPGSAAVDRYLDELNTALLAKLKSEGEVYLSNAIVRGKYVLRACVVNFRTTQADVAAIPEIVARAGRSVDATLRPNDLR
jgi:glutamate/tyrosine decarboxylase-like PLP-dependent enzyme